MATGIQAQRICNFGTCAGGEKALERYFSAVREGNNTIETKREKRAKYIVYKNTGGKKQKEREREGQESSVESKSPSK